MLSGPAKGAPSVPTLSSSGDESVPCASIYIEGHKRRKERVQTISTRARVQAVTKGGKVRKEMNEVSQAGIGQSRL